MDKFIRLTEYQPHLPPSDGAELRVRADALVMYGKDNHYGEASTKIYTTAFITNVRETPEEIDVLLSKAEDNAKSAYNQNGPDEETIKLEVIEK